MNSVGIPDWAMNLLNYCVAKRSHRPGLDSVSGFLADELAGQILIDGGPTGPGFPGGCDQGSTWVLTCA